ncbi:MAG TPA: hypothetical protein VIV11_25920 [Kofleriaceae bacterium]
MTPDIVKLREELPTLEPIIDRLELQLVDDPTWDEPSDTSYLSDADRNNPDIAANVDAMAETNKLIAWFGRDAEGYLGLWRGPNNRSLTEAPVVRLDTEGQYSIVAATVPEYLAIAMPEDEFADTRDTLTKAGFKVGFNPDAIWGALDAFDDDPNAYRNELYERNRVARGLPRTDAEDEEAEGDQTDGVPEERDFASGSMPEIPAIVTSGDDDIDDDDDDGAGDAVVTDDGGDEDDDDDEPAPRAAAPVTQPAKAAAKAPAKAKPAAKAAAKAPAKKAAAKVPAKKAAAKAPAKKAALKPAAKKAAPRPAKGAAKKAAAKPAKKAAAKAPAKKAAKPAKKKR